MLCRLKKTALGNLPGITHHTLQVPLPQDKKSVAQQKEKKFFAHLQNLRGICDHLLLADLYLNLSDDGENFTQMQSQNYPESTSKSDQTIPT